MYELFWVYLFVMTLCIIEMHTYRIHMHIHISHSRTNIDDMTLCVHYYLTLIMYLLYCERLLSLYSFALAGGIWFD